MIRTMVVLKQINSGENQTSFPIKRAK